MDATERQGRAVTPFESWALLALLGSLAVLAAVAVADWIERADERADERSMRDWQAMCRELDLEPYDQDRDA
jgi:hypothetical protein